MRCDSPAAPPHIQTLAEATEAQIARIDALTGTGRANWLGLLAYLAFALITTLGVQDIDFFVDSRQTQLPLVDVSIPTFSFFVFAPILGAALYAYLHLHIRKVTEALTEGPTGTVLIEERIKPWLLNDFVLLRRREAAIRRRPMDWLVTLTTLLLVWWAGPIVLGVMWVWTWPAHELWLSALCAVCLMVTVYAGAISWVKMQRDMGQQGLSFLVITIFVVLLAPPVAFLTLANSLGISTVPKWLQIEGELIQLDPPNLRGARLSVLPPDEADPETARRRYRKGFCDRRGIDAETCDQPSSLSAEVPAHLSQRRADWCTNRGYTTGAQGGCDEFFAILDHDFTAEWTAYRSTQLASISKPSFAGRDLRRADLFSAELSGMNFNWAKLQGANLLQAHMQGADLSEAQMQGADLRKAQMQGAKLWVAKMQGAYLSEAQMQGANLSGAQMNGADLSEAQMQGADLRYTQMQGMDLSKAHMQGADLSDAQMQGANLWQVQMQGAYWLSTKVDGTIAHEADLRGGQGASQTLLSLMIGDERTLLPEERDPDTGQRLHIPSCWVAEPEGWTLLINNLDRRVFPVTESEARAAFLCAPDEKPQKTGTPWPLDQPPPWETDPGCWSGDWQPVGVLNVPNVPA